MDCEVNMLKLKRKRRIKTGLAICLFTVLLIGCGGAEQNTTSNTNEGNGVSFMPENNESQIIEINNPLIEQRADPWIYRHTDGFYYFTATVPEYDRLILRRSYSGTVAVK